MSSREEKTENLRRELLERQINVIQEEIDNISRQIAMYDQLIAEKESMMTMVKCVTILRNTWGLPQRRWLTLQE